MHIRSFVLAAVASFTLATSAFADCKNFPIETPDNAPVNRVKVVGSGGALNGTAYTKATFCPAAAAAGTCTGESLSERVGSIAIPFVTYDGNVADIERHRNGFYIGPVFIPLTGYIPGAC